MEPGRLKNAHDLFHFTAGRLAENRDRAEAEAQAFVLTEHLFGLSRTDILARKTGDFPTEKLDKILFRLARHEPLQYVLGEAWFYGRRFSVGPGVLIPRPETEELVHFILEQRKNTGRQAVWDFGTGSGCIALTLAAERPDWSVVAYDLSGAALEFARKNGRDLAPQVRFLRYDMLGSEPPKEPEPDILVSNPPYVRESEKTRMDVNVLDYEPDIALFVPDSAPLPYYRALFRTGAELLKTEGLLCAEINESLAADTAALALEAGFSQLRIHKDMSGKDRILEARK